MQQIESLLTLPIGKCLSEGNWESHVYEHGDKWVYKEIKKPDSIDTKTVNYKMRRLLQEFWNNETHYLNMQKDYKIFKSVIGDLIPETLFCRSTSLLKTRGSVIVSVQERLVGNLLKKGDVKKEKVTELAKSVRVVCEEVFAAPADFHAGNLLITNSSQLYFFDTGTPSDWEYFHDAEKFSYVTQTSLKESRELVNFMQPIYIKHWQNIIDFCR